MLSFHLRVWGDSVAILNDDRWIEELNKEFAGQSDRAAAIVGATILDELLKVVLCDFLIDDKKKIKVLFGGYMPLSTFNSRIEICYCLGLIGQQEYDLLKIIKSVRNDFAHKISGTSFASGSIKDKCQNIKLPREVVANDLSPRFIYQEAVKYLGMLLIIRSFQANNRRCVKLDNLPPVTDFTAALTKATIDERAEIPSLSELLEDIDEE